MRTTVRAACLRRKPATDTIRWARATAALPASVLASAHGVTVREAERIQAILADLAGQAGAR